MIISGNRTFCGISEYPCRRLVGHLLLSCMDHAARNSLMGIKYKEIASGVARTGIWRMMIIRTTIGSPLTHKLELQP